MIYKAKSILDSMNHFLQVQLLSWPSRKRRPKRFGGELHDRCSTLTQYFERVTTASEETLWWLFTYLALLQMNVYIKHFWLSIQYLRHKSLDWPTNLAKTIRIEVGAIVLKELAAVVRRSKYKALWLFRGSVWELDTHTLCWQWVYGNEGTNASSHFHNALLWLFSFFLKCLFISVFIQMLHPFSLQLNCATAEFHWFVRGEVRTKAWKGQHRLHGQRLEQKPGETWHSLQEKCLEFLNHLVERKARWAAADRGSKGVDEWGPAWEADAQSRTEIRLSFIM